MTEPTQSDKSIAILRALGYRVISYYDGNRDSYELYSWGEKNPFTSYEICFEEIIPMMERAGFRLVIEHGRSGYSVNFIYDKDGYETVWFYEINPDIRTAICEATYSYLKAEGKG